MEGTTVGARTIEDRIAMIDAKIEKKQAEIAALEAQKYKLQHPVSMRAVMDGCAYECNPSIYILFYCHSISKISCVEIFLPSVIIIVCS